jgi:adenine-specific DNA-methyltransferase
MNYIGSKFSLLGEIQAMLARQGATGGSFCDLFSGTAIVAQMARQSGYRVIANDVQAYSHVMQQAFLETSGYPAFARLREAVGAIDRADADAPRASFGLGPTPGATAAPLRRVLAHLEGLPPVAGAFFDAYCEGGAAGRNYFSAENGRKLEAMRGAIEAWRAGGLIDEIERAVLLASVIETIDQVANTASVYGAYLKHVKKSARAPLTLRLPRLIDKGAGHRAVVGDATALVRSLAAEGREGVLYLDPPYNHRQYNANYHLLETIARWDLAEFEPRGKTGLRPETAPSPFCSRRHVKRAFADLIEAANFDHILVSYSNEGLLAEDDLKGILAEKGRCEFHKVPYKRFRADADGENRVYKGDETQEFLFYVQVASRSAVKA